jgi:hypothetical protein
MSSHQGFHVVDFAIGGRAAVIGVAVPTGEAGFGVAGLRGGCGGRRGRNPHVLLVGAPGQSHNQQHEREAVPHAN